MLWLQILPQDIVVIPIDLEKVFKIIDVWLGRKDSFKMTFSCKLLLRFEDYGPVLRS